MIHYLETGSNDPCYNLAFEEHVLERRREGDWLMLWQNAPSVILGLNQNAAEEVDVPWTEAHGVAVVRRATGGGAVYHDLGNLNFSLFSDAGEAAGLSLSRFIEPVRSALASLGVPAEATGRNDITVCGRKVSGTAQRLSAGRVLFHGTLLFETDAAAMSAALRPHPDKFSSKAAKSVRSRVGQLRDFLPPGTTLQDFRAELLAALTRSGLACESLSAPELAEVERLAREKYRSWDWTWGRSPDFGFNVRRRFPGGVLQLSLDVSGGVIRAAAVRGDFMASLPCSPLESALCGLPFTPEALRAALSRLELSPMLGSITADEFLSAVFD